MEKKDLELLHYCLSLSKKFQSTESKCYGSYRCRSCLCLKEGNWKAAPEVGLEAWEVYTPWKGTVRESRNCRLDGPEPCLGRA